MDPVKQLGKVREQVDRENITRRKYPHKHAAVSNKEANDKLYNQNFINDELSKTKAYRPYQYTGEGESYFLSKDMYNSLLATCRCGRPRNDGHAIKCLQKEKNKYLDPIEKAIVITDFGTSTSKINEHLSNSLKITDEKNESDENVIVKPQNNLSQNKEDISKNINENVNDGKSFCTGKLPATSNGMIGWMKKPYWKWEKSTYYISPKYTMAGYKIDDHPYSNIFIG